MMIQPQPTPYTPRRWSQMLAWATGNNTCRTSCHCEAPLVTATSRKADGHVGDVLDDQRQQRDEAADEQEPDLLGFARAEPGHAQRDEDHNRHVGPRQGEGAEEGRDGGEGGHVNPQRQGDEGGERKAGRHSQPGGEGAAHQALFDVQGHERPQHLHRAGQDERLNDSVLLIWPRVRNHQTARTTPTNKAVSPSARA